MFLHGTIGHIFFNLFALWMFGQAIENLWGTKRFVYYYFITGIGAGIIQMLVSSGAPTIGASGAVFGILLAFGMMFPNRPIMLLFFPFPIKAKYFVAIFGVFQLLNGIGNTASNVAYFAHLGGMVFGFVIIQYWKYRGKLR
jgi:membrane associated rhomboid family serine protease